MRFKVHSTVLIFFLAFLCSFSLYGQEYDKEDLLDSNLPSLEMFNQNIKAFILKYYPEAQISTTDISIKFEYETREFMVHDPLKTGDWSKYAHKILGPKAKVFSNDESRVKSGILGSISLEPMQYISQITRPQTLYYSYFKYLMLAPESKKFGCCLKADLIYPFAADKRFVEEFTALVNEFENYLKK